MIKECLITGTGILFEAEVLSKFEFDFDALENTLDKPLAMVGLGFADGVGIKKTLEDVAADDSNTQAPSSPSPTASRWSHLLSKLYDIAKPIIEDRYSSLFKSLDNYVSPDVIQQAITDVGAMTDAYQASDTFSAIYDQLIMKWAWWTLEWLPTFTTYQTPSGEWMQRRMYVDFSLKGKFLFILTPPTGETLEWGDTSPFLTTIRFWYTSLLKTESKD